MMKDNWVLVWNNEQQEHEIKEHWIPLLEQLMQLTGESEQLTNAEIALTFVDDHTIRELNQQYRAINKVTDVLSFSMLEVSDEEIPIIYEEEWNEPIGDIVISVHRAYEQATEYGHSIEREIGFLFVHGFLHLIGYDHQDESAEQVMMAKQEMILQKAGLTR